MSAYQWFLASLNKKISEKNKITKKEKNNHYNNIFVKNSIILLGEECFNSHLNAILEGAFDFVDKESATAEDYHNCVGNLFHKGFRQYDVSEQYTREKFKQYYNTFGYMNTKIAHRDRYVDGWVDTTMHSALSLRSDFWSILYEYVSAHFEGAKK